MANYHYSYGGNKGGSSQRMKKKSSWVIYLILALIIVSAPIAYFVLSNDGPTPEDTPKTPSDVNNNTPPTQDNSNKTQPQPISGDISSLIQRGNDALSNNEYGDAKNIALKIINNPSVKSYTKTWEQAIEILNAANTKIIMTGYFLEGKKLLYTVKRGDALARIAKKFKTTVTAIQLNNGMKSTDYNIRIGQTLSIYSGDWRIVINKQHFRLFLYDGKEPFKVYRVGLGKQNRTPLGTFVITGKTKEPDWYSPQGKIPYGDKRNVLGTRWMKLKPTGTTNPGLRGYGIHGTAYPDSIGKTESNGCIRMKNSIVEELFSIVPSGVNVTIEK